MELPKLAFYPHIKRPRLAHLFLLAALAAHLLAPPAVAIPFKILVKDREGRAMANASVTLLNPANSETRSGQTNAEGWALINHDWPAGTSIQVQIRAPGQAPLDLPYETRGTSGMTGVDDVYLSGSPVQMTPPVATGVSIEVAVTNEKDEPVSGALVTIPGLGGKPTAGGVASFGPYDPETFTRKAGLSIQVSMKGYFVKMDYIDATALQVGTVRRSIQLKINPAESPDPVVQIKAAFVAAEEAVAVLRAVVDLYMEYSNRLLADIQAPDKSLGVSAQTGAELQTALKAGSAALAKIGQCRAAVQPIFKAAETALGDIAALPTVEQLTAAESHLQLLTSALQPLGNDMQGYKDRLSAVRDILQAVRAAAEKEQALVRRGTELDQNVRKAITACKKKVAKVDQLREDAGQSPPEYGTSAFWTTLLDMDKQVQGKATILNDALRLLHGQLEKIQGQVLSEALQSDDARRLFTKSMVAMTEKLGSDEALTAAKLTYTPRLPATAEDEGGLIRAASENGHDTAQLLVDALTGTRDRYTTIATSVADRLKKIAQIEIIGPEKLAAATKSGNTAAAEIAKKELKRAAEVKPLREQQQERCAAALKILNPLIEQVKTQRDKPLATSGGGLK